MLHAARRKQPSGKIEKVILISESNKNIIKLTMISLRLSVN